MGMHLLEHVHRYAPDDLTYKQLHVLVVLAGDAWDASRVVAVDLTGNHDLLMRLRMPRRDAYQALEALIERGALEVESTVDAGHWVFRLSDCGVPTARHLRAVT